MADNFLEQRMDDLRKGLLKPSVSKQKPRPPFMGDIWIPDIDSENPEELRRLANEGWRVYVGGGANAIEASRLARTIGCKYIPSGMNPPSGCISKP